MENLISNAINECINTEDIREAKNKDHFTPTSLNPGKKISGMLELIAFIQGRTIPGRKLSDMVSTELALYIMDDPELGEHLVKTFNASPTSICWEGGGAMAKLEKEGCFEIYVPEFMRERATEEL